MRITLGCSNCGADAILVFEELAFPDVGSELGAQGLEGPLGPLALADDAADMEDLGRVRLGHLPQNLEPVDVFHSPSCKCGALT